MQNTFYEKSGYIDYITLCMIELGLVVNIVRLYFAEQIIIVF